MLIDNSFVAPLAYAQMQVVAQAVESTRSLDDAVLSEFTRGAAFSTVMGEVTFGTRGKWTRPRVLQVQFQGITGHDLDRLGRLTAGRRGTAGGGVGIPDLSVREARIP